MSLSPLYPKTQERVTIDNGLIYLPTGQPVRSLNREELKGLLAFCTLSKEDRNALRTKALEITSIPQLIHDVKGRPEKYSSALYRRLVQSFEQILH